MNRMRLNGRQRSRGCLWRPFLHPSSNQAAIVPGLFHGKESITSYVPSPSQRKHKPRKKCGKQMAEEKPSAQVARATLRLTKIVRWPPAFWINTPCVYKHGPYTPAHRRIRVQGFSESTRVEEMGLSLHKPNMNFACILNTLKGMQRLFYVFIRCKCQMCMAWSNQC